MNKNSIIMVAAITVLSVALTFSGRVYAADTNITDGITVDSTLDTADSNVGDGQCDDGSGNCTLRAAIEEANSNSDTSTINFNITGAANFTNGGQNGYTISPATFLPPITETVVIDGYSQPGAEENTAIAPNPLNGILLVEVDNSGISAGSGLTLSSTSASGSSISGMVVNGAFQDGISILAVDDVTITGSYVGTDPTGLIDKGNSQRGIGTDNAQTNNNIRIGGTSPADRNLISGNNNAEGISIGIGASNWTIQGNYIGVNSLGAAAIANGGGGISAVTNTVGTDNLIGGADTGAANVFSGNGAVGIFIGGGSYTVQGNLVGTDYSGSTGMGNTQVGVVLYGNNTSVLNNVISDNGVGLYIVGNSNIAKSNNIGTTLNGDDGGIGNISDGVAVISGSSGNIIGGITASESNTIAHNGGAGISVMSISIASLTPIDNSILGNRIYGNTALGIDIADDSDGNQIADIDVGPNANDAGDLDTGANGYLNYPVINSTSATAGNLNVNFDLDVDNNAPNGYRIEFFANDTAHSSGYGEGKYYLGSMDVASSQNGVNANLSVPESFTDGTYAITATTTEKDNSTDGFGATSEFSQVLSNQTVLAAEATSNPGGNTVSTTNPSDSTNSNNTLASTGENFNHIALFSAALISVALATMKASHTHASKR